MSRLFFVKGHLRYLLKIIIKTLKLSSKHKIGILKHTNSFWYSQPYEFIFRYILISPNFTAIENKWYQLTKSKFFLIPKVLQLLYLSLCSVCFIRHDFSLPPEHHPFFLGYFFWILFFELLPLKDSLILLACIHVIENVVKGLEPVLENGSASFVECFFIVFGVLCNHNEWCEFSLVALCFDFFLFVTTMLFFDKGLECR